MPQPASFREENQALRPFDAKMKPHRGRMRNDFIHARRVLGGRLRRRPASAQPSSGLGNAAFGPQKYRVKCRPGELVAPCGTPNASFPSSFSSSFSVFREFSRTRTRTMTKTSGASGFSKQALGASERKAFRARAPILAVMVHFSVVALAPLNWPIRRTGWLYRSRRNGLGYRI